MSVTLPEVAGDPGGMRALAASLRRAAGQIEQVVASASAAVASTTFEGPAGDRFRQRETAGERSITSAATVLSGLAGTLERVAAEVEREQAARAAKLLALQRDAILERKLGVS